MKCPKCKNELKPIYPWVSDNYLRCDHCKRTYLKFEGSYACYPIDESYVFPKGKMNKNFRERIKKVRIDEV